MSTFVQNTPLLAFVVFGIGSATGKLTNTKNWSQRSRIVAVTAPDHVVQKPLGGFGDKLWKALEV